MAKLKTWEQLSKRKQKKLKDKAKALVKDR